MQLMISKGNSGMPNKYEYALKASNGKKEEEVVVVEEEGNSIRMVVDCPPSELSMKVIKGSLDFNSFSFHTPQLCSFSFSQTTCK